MPKLCNCIFCEIYPLKSDIVSNVACDWSKWWFYIADKADLVQNNVFLLVNVKKYFRIGITIFKIFIWGGILSYIRFYGDASSPN